MPNISINEPSNETSIDDKFVAFFEHWKPEDYIHMAMGAGATVLAGLTILCIKSCYKSCHATPYNALSELELPHHFSTYGGGRTAGPPSIIKVTLDGIFDGDTPTALVGATNVDQGTQ